VVVLVTIGGYVFFDAWKLAKTGASEKVSSLAQRLQKINLPPMIHFKTANLRISLWFTVPVGFATGMLAATIAVGGFIGVPGMIYVIGASGLVSSASELVVAFVMGLGGTANWAWHGMVDIRLTLIILAGSLFGVQLGAIGTTYVKGRLQQRARHTEIFDPAQPSDHERRDCSTSHQSELCHDVRGPVNRSINYPRSHVERKAGGSLSSLRRSWNYV